MGSSSSTSSTRRVTSEECSVGSSSSTVITRRVNSEEWAVHHPPVALVLLLMKSGTIPPPLVALVVLLLKSGQFLTHN